MALLEWYGHNKSSNAVPIPFATKRPSNSLKLSIIGNHEILAPDITGPLTDRWRHVESSLFCMMCHVRNVFIRLLYGFLCYSCWESLWSIRRRRVCCCSWEQNAKPLHSCSFLLFLCHDLIFERYMMQFRYPDIVFRFSAPPYPPLLNCRTFCQGASKKEFKHVWMLLKQELHESNLEKNLRTTFFFDPFCRL